MTAPVAGLDLRPASLAAPEDLARAIDGCHGEQEVTVRLPGARALQLIAPVVGAQRSGREFTVEFALDAEADATAALGGQATSLTPLLEASRLLRQSAVPVRWLVPLLGALVYRLEALFSLARDEGVDALLVPPALAQTDGAPAVNSLDADEARFARDFIAYRLLDEDQQRVAPARLAFYRALLAAPDGAGLPTSPGMAVMLAAAGAGWVASPVVRPAASADGGPSLPQATRLGHALEVAGVLFEGQRALLQWLGATALRPWSRRGAAPPQRQLPRVLLIGAYGGEHIGDAAILGGVLLRIHRRYGTTSAVLVSQRPEHTRHLVAMLDTPVEVAVDLYEQGRIPAHLAAVDGVVFAGGPLTDLPKQLVKHLYTASRAFRRSQPFIIEGVGAGPFVRRVSAWTGRRIVRLAERITVRTADDARAPLVRDLAPDVGRDPAFDYLETCSAPIARLPAADRQWIDRLLAGAAGRLRVGVNLRPIRDLYTVGVPGHARISHTRDVEAGFEQQVAEGLCQFQRTLPAPPCFVFFPMNAIQFGSSDLRSAYRLKRLLGDEVDLRIWEGDPGIDGVVALLRTLDVVVAMRFHAAIYALSQGRPVIGIDYRIGRRDKVAALLGDFGQPENCARIDELTAGWLAERLTALAPPAGQVRARDATAS